MNPEYIAKRLTVEFEIRLNHFAEKYNFKLDQAIKIFIKNNLKADFLKAINIGYEYFTEHKKEYDQLINNRALIISVDTKKNVKVFTSIEEASEYHQIEIFKIEDYLEGLNIKLTRKIKFFKL